MIIFLTTVDGADRRYIELKYKIAWYIGTVLSFLLYFSGIVPLYVYLRRRFKKHIVFVLMYHRVADNSDEPDITVSTMNFERQMAYLKENFNIVSLEEIMELIKSEIKRDTIAVTFDDGYKDNYANAYPVLKKYNIPATIFVATGYIGQSSRLNKAEIIDMRKDGITFGAHTVTHRVLSGLDNQTAFLEISCSKADMEEILKEKVKYFAYPYGKKNRDFTDKSMQIVKETHYAAAFSTDNGFIDRASDIFALKRIGVRNVPLFVVKARLSGIFENRFFYILRKLVRI